ncbi:MAG: hypothetical protein Q9225_007833, partial [Loekoesia sp. 1 TL-2023]
KKEISPLFVVQGWGLANIPYPFFLPKIQSARFWEAVIVDNYHSSRFKGRNEVFQNTDAVLIRPIVENPPEEIDVGTFDRLLGEEIMGHKLHAICKFARHPGLAFFYHFGKILDNAFELRKG